MYIHDYKWRIKQGQRVEVREDIRPYARHTLLIMEICADVQGAASLQTALHLCYAQQVKLNRLDLIFIIFFNKFNITQLILKLQTTISTNIKKKTFLTLLSFKILFK